MSEPWKMPAGIARAPQTGREPQPIPARAPVKDFTLGMNKTEERRALELHAMKLAGEIAAWWWEGFTFKLGFNTRYTPDFVIQERDGSLRVEEVKGSFWRDDARAKTKIFASMYPFPTRVLQEMKRGKPWKIEEVKP